MFTELADNSYEEEMIIHSFLSIYLAKPEKKRLTTRQRKILGFLHEFDQKKFCTLDSQEHVFANGLYLNKTTKPSLDHQMPAWGLNKVLHGE